MNRTYISNAISKIALRHGCSFVEADTGSIAAHVRTYPALWLEPIVLQSKTGRYHGRIFYSVRLHLMHEGLRMPPDERRAAFDSAERTLLDIFTELSTDPRIACVDRLKISVSQFEYTPHGEIAATAEALLDTIY